MSLLDDISAFVQAHNITERKFGELALNDKNVVRQIRDGRRLWPETEAKMRRFMATYPNHGRIAA